MRTIFPLFLGALAATFYVCGTHAATITFDLDYSGVAFSNSAIGVGTISFDDTVFPNGPTSNINVSPATLGITGFSITISGATSGNGTFGLADFAGDPDRWIWNLTAPVDFGADLVGQAGFSDFNWCASSFSCGSATAPGGTAALEITTAGELGDKLNLVSMTAIPVPSAVWLFGSALGLLGWIRRK